MTDATPAADHAAQDIIARLEQIDERLSRLERKQEPNDYQGWTNYETWVVSLWMDNDVKQYLRMKGLAEKHLLECAGDKVEAAILLADALQKETEDGVPSYLKGVYADLLNGALDGVNYDEIARHWMRDIELPPPSPEPPAPVPPPTEPRAEPPAGKNTLAASPEVLDVLSRSNIDDEGLTLPPEQLPPDQYAAVNKFLELAGAKWHKGKKRHLFKAGAREKIDGLLSSGQILDEKKHFQAFYTPQEVAHDLVRIAGVQPDMDCLEPSAGDGVIATALREAGARVTCIELNPDAAEKLRARGFDPAVKDFLSVEPVAAYDRVVMNPPFTNNQDIDHVLHAFEFLKPGGKLVAIMGKGFLFGEQRKRAEFRQFLESHGKVVQDLPRGTFQESGTMVETVVVELVRGPLPATSIQGSLLT
jgi:predicted RNA methylase